MVCRVQVSLEPEPEPEKGTVRLAGRLTAAQLNERPRAYALRRRPSLLPIASRSTPRWFSPRLAAGGAARVAVAECLGHMTGPL
jgi:hypothetical protein